MMKHTLVDRDSMLFRSIVEMNPGIDKERLLVELRVVQLNAIENGNFFVPNERLNDSFSWFATPQGRPFWSRLSAGLGFP